MLPSGALHLLLTVCRVSFGSNGIYVGGKDTFLSELSGRFSVTGEMAPVGVTGAPGPVARITVQLGSAGATAAPVLAKCVSHAFKVLATICRRRCL